MKYLKTFESVTNYNVDVLTSKEFNELYNKIYPNFYDSDFNLKDKIEFFSWDSVNVSSYYSSEKHSKSLRVTNGWCFLYHSIESKWKKLTYLY